MRKGLINKSDICNLSRLPIHLNENPIYKTCLEIIDNPGIPPQDTSLFRHYQDYNPSTLYDLYGAVDKLKDYSYQQSFLPWLHSSPVVQYSDIAFIDRKRDFIYDQVHKIKNLISSVEKYGYKSVETIEYQFVSPLILIKKHLSSTKSIIILKIGI